jgi:23S rRNA pseudouridine2457 synthase
MVQNPRDSVSVSTQRRSDLKRKNNNFRGDFAQAGAGSARGFKPRHDRLYLAFYKPYGVLTQFTQPPDSDKQTLAIFGFPQHVYPIGRLDWDSEGLLLLSDDAALNGAVLDPKHAHARTYFVQVENEPDSNALSQLERGVIIEGKKTLPAHAALIPEPALPPRAVPIRYRKSIPTAWIALTLTEGRNRQVRRMTAAVGHPTLRLVRHAIGGIELPALNLEPGKWRHLSHSEIMQAFTR